MGISIHGRSVIVQEYQNKDKFWWIYRTILTGRDLAQHSLHSDGLQEYHIDSAEIDTLRPVAVSAMTYES